MPTNVTLKADDGVEFHNQLFLPKNMKPGEKHPALIFVHGGPPRQMLLGWHYLSFYHVFYGVNQWLASQGYIVLSVNYRRGVGYGRAFRQAAERRRARQRRNTRTCSRRASGWPRGRTSIRIASASGACRTAAC